MIYSRKFDFLKVWAYSRDIKTKPKNCPFVINSKICPGIGNVPMMYLQYTHIVHSVLTVYL